MNIVIFGPPGSGKGTQSLNIINKYNLLHISTGDIMREAVKSLSPLGIRVKEFLDKGELVPDEVVIDVLIGKINSSNGVKGFVFDGFPRTLNQAVMLDKILDSNKIPIDLVLAVDVEEEEIFKRIIGRKTSLDRSDDNEAIIKNRLEVYKKQTLPIFDYYNKQKKLIKINGMASIETVFNRMVSEIDKLLS